MSLLDVLRSGVKIIDQVTKPLQPEVTYERAIKDPTGYGTKYAPPVQLRAIVDWKQKQVRTMTGILTVSRASIILLNVAEVAAATAGVGIDDDDRFTLPDGTTGPILDMSGFIDAGTGEPLATEIYLG